MGNLFAHCEFSISLVYFGPLKPGQPQLKLHNAMVVRSLKRCTVPTSAIAIAALLQASTPPTTDRPSETPYGIWAPSRWANRPILHFRHSVGSLARFRHPDGMAHCRDVFLPADSPSTSIEIATGILFPSWNSKCAHGSAKRNSIVGAVIHSLFACCLESGRSFAP